VDGVGGDERMTEKHYAGYYISRRGLGDMVGDEHSDGVWTIDAFFTCRK
jgi:hypothetical protein